MPSGRWGTLSPCAGTKGAGDTVLRNTILLWSEFTPTLKNGHACYYRTGALWCCAFTGQGGRTRTSCTARRPITPRDGCRATSGAN